MKINKFILKYLGYNQDLNQIIVDDGLKKHLLKRNHQNMLPYLPIVDQIINNPDYIGKNPNIKGTSFECVKIFDENILVAVKLDVFRGRFYVASIYEITNAKLDRNVKSGRLKKVDNKEIQ